jgi:hypothetical protein
LPTCRDPGILPSHPLWREVRIVMGQRCPAHEPTRVFDANRDLTVMQHASVQTPRSIGNCAIETLGLNHLLAVSIFVPTIYAQDGADHGSQGSY